MAELSAAEQAYQHSLETLYEHLRVQSADPQTPGDVRELLGPQIAKLADQLEEVEAGAFHRGTVELQGAADGLAPAMKSLMKLKADLDEIAKRVKTFTTVADDAQKAINTLLPLVTG